MSLSSVAHAIFPAAFRDIGSGLYHLAKRDATEKQCQKLVSATLRVITAAAIALAALSSLYYVNSEILGTLSILAINITAYILDPETCYLAKAATLTTMGVCSLALAINLAVHSFYGIGAIVGAIGSAFIGFGYCASRYPRDQSLFTSKETGVLTHLIDKGSFKVGNELFYRLA